MTVSSPSFKSRLSCSTAGKVFLERAWQVAGTAAAAVAAALATGLHSIPADSRFQGLQNGSDGSLPAVVDIAAQIVLLAGTSPLMICSLCGILSPFIEIVLM